MQISDQVRNNWPLALVAAGGFATLLALEAVTEGGLTPLEFLLEALELSLVIATAAGVALLIGRIKTQHEEKMALMRDLEAARVEGASWREQARSHLAGLGAAIESQLHSWKLTEAECEVALLMLKGFSHKEIASLRGTSEATVRQQARSAYEKSGLKGRAPFCAFFLEDILPSDATGTVASHQARHGNAPASTSPANAGLPPG
jgi:DNA-binding CsgD family transcriptional regulator